MAATSRRASQNALLHSQFETIHPFLDGNGRLGRLLLIFFLVMRDTLGVPLLYLSTHLERNRQDHYESLQAIREAGEDYLGAAIALRTPNALSLVALICENPVVTTKSIETRLGVSRPTALRLLRRMVECEMRLPNDGRVG
ncbi:MAG: Fic family protein [Actinobacteria bacterium]|nr:Fic family protein [Actinomycetota bacterium]